ncbi:MAG: hypothetical protein ACRC37_04045 [Lentisphaeria bacterium]
MRKLTNAQVTISIKKEDSVKFICVRFLLLFTTQISASSLIYFLVASFSCWLQKKHLFGAFLLFMNIFYNVLSVANARKTKQGTTNHFDVYLVSFLPAAFTLASARSRQSYHASHFTPSPNIHNQFSNSFQLDCDVLVCQE